MVVGVWRGNGEGGLGAKKRRGWSMAWAAAAGLVLTGMGDDGARGLAEMHETGAYTIAQDEASCVVYGMPREAWLMGGSEKEVPLDLIASEVVKLIAKLEGN